MRKLLPVLLAFGIAAQVFSWASAQPPAGTGKDAAKDFSNSSIVTKMMAFNTTKDGKLTKEQVTDPRLLRLFEMADTNKDGVVTREELMALAAKLDEEFPAGGGFGDKGSKGKGGPKGKGGGGPGEFGKGPGGPGDFGKGPGSFGKGPGGPGGFGPPQPGQVLPAFLQDMLQLTADQRKQLDGLQQEVDGKLAKILTDAQKEQLKEMQQRGSFGKGPPPKKQ
jgi:hypothetical protein